MTRLTLIAIVGALIWSPGAISPAGAEPDRVGRGRIYSDATLARARTAYQTNVRQTWADIQQRVAPRWAAAAASVQLSLPTVGASPLDFHADPVARTVFAPIESIKFLDDLATAMAFKQMRNCDIGTVFDYVAMVALHRGQKLLPEPIPVLGVPADILKTDAYVYDVSGKALKSALYFILLHELAHVLLEHPGNHAASKQQSQANEVAADAFALAEMARIGVPPVGMFVYFGAAGRYEPSPGALDEDTYRQWVAETATHPLAARRLLEIVRGLRARREAIQKINSTAQVDYLATQIQQLAEILDSSDIRRFHDVRSRRRQWNTLADCGTWEPPHE